MGLRRALTLIELLAALSIIASLLTLLIPAVQVTRESARAAGCQNNLRQIGVGLASFESAHERFPKGVEGRYDRRLSPVIMFGFSWWVELLPYLEQAELVDRLDRVGAHTGWVQLNTHNGQVADEFAPPWFFCPASPVDHLVFAGGFRLAAPSYVGISGASSHDGFDEARVSTCCRSDGEISAGGVLVPNTVVGVEQIPDGLSKTLLVGEQSDFVFTETGSPRRIDGGQPNGWLTGANALGVPPAYGSSFSPAYNITTIRYGLNERRYELPGIYNDRGANNPLISPHVGVVHGLNGDGSVRNLGESIEVEILKQLATRDDASQFGVVATD